MPKDWVIYLATGVVFITLAVVVTALSLLYSISLVSYIVNFIISLFNISNAPLPVVNLTTVQLFKLLVIIVAALATVGGFLVYAGLTLHSAYRHSKLK